MQTIADYTIEEHKHILSTWAAATAASRSPKSRFKVQAAKKVLETLDIREVIKEIPKLKSSEAFDAWHDKQCSQLVKLAKGKIVGFRYGVSAKLLNCYLKVYFIDQLKIFKFIHPPIDRPLLDSLARKDFGGLAKKVWKPYKSRGWSNFSRDDYKQVIASIKEALKRELKDEKSLWKIEYYWPGHQ
jgi:hypothetical protein